jgi:hypothetical protein
VRLGRGSRAEVRHNFALVGNRLNASTAPGLVVWSSSVRSSSFLPRTPPSLFTTSMASLAPPFIRNRPCSALAPVMESIRPILIVSSAVLPFTARLNRTTKNHVSECGVAQRRTPSPLTSLESGSA